MRPSPWLYTALLYGAPALACVHDLNVALDYAARHKRHAHMKRAVEFPPQLDPTETLLVNSFDNNSISSWSYYYTHGDHLGGHNKTMAEWTAEKWAESGFTTSLAEYYVHVTYPRNISLTLHHPNGSTKSANFNEDVLAEDSVTSYPNRIPAYHAMSGSGNVTAEYVYVGRGTQGDFARLKKLGVKLEGKIAVAKYGGGYRGLKVKNSQDNGMIGCVIFTDPGDDGSITEKNGYKAYPDGPARNPSSIQRGSVRFSSLYSGDPTTVGYASTKDAPRGDTAPYTPSIPSVPISYADAIPILNALDGHGITAKEANRSGWIGGLDVSYHSGPAAGVTLNMVNLMDAWITPVWNTIGYINGTHSDEVIILGNHRDAWVVGGAADPNSGSAILVELTRAFGKLLATGWKPRRTIILGSWDAEEFGLQGSTEWVEDHLPWLTGAAIAYLNVDVAVSGPRTALTGSGELQTIALDMMKKVLFPEKYQIGKTLYEAWYNTTKGAIPSLGSGSDFAAFVHLAGISALDIGSDAGPNDPVYHYHGNYDSFFWQSTYGDPGFKLHTTMGQFVTLLTYHLVNDPLLPFDLPNAATVLRDYYADLQSTIKTAGVTLNTRALENALDTFEKRAKAIKKIGDTALAFNDSVLLDVVNTKYKDFARGFVSVGGLPKRPTFKNVLSAPGLDNGYGASVFPPITEAAEQKDMATANEWIEKTAKAILRAAEILRVGDA